jgi:hypothetical protein
MTSAPGLSLPPRGPIYRPDCGTVSSGFNPLGFFVIAYLTSLCRRIKLIAGTALKSVDFPLRRDRGIAAAQAFFRKGLATNPTRWPRKVTVEGHTPSNQALRLLRRERKYMEVRTCKYLNNVVEQDHRAIKRRCASMKGFKSITNAAITIAGIELAHRIHKRQFSFGLGRPRRNWSLKIRWQKALA